MNDAPNDFDFYINMYLKYIYDVDEMALEKKKRFLSHLFKNICSRDSGEQQNSAYRTDAADFAELE